MKSILSFLPQRPKSWQHQVHYWPGDWTAKKSTILCDVNALSKLSQLCKDRFIHPGLVAMIILVEIICDKRTYLSMYIQSVFPLCFCYADALEEWGAKKALRKWQRFILSQSP